MGEADGSIMAVIMTAHIAQSSNKCGASQLAVIIHALAPVIGPYISRAITTIHVHDTSGIRTSRATRGVRSYRNADSRIVGVRSSGAGCGMYGITITELFGWPERADESRSTTQGGDVEPHNEPLGSDLGLLRQIVRVG